jgi:hypothetical protein
MELPSSGAALALVGHYGRLRARLRQELRHPKLVLPTNEYFPDRFDGSQAAAQRLVHRMQSHAHIEDIPVRVVIGESDNAANGSCSSGACGTAQAVGNARLELHPDGWNLQLTSAELGHPVALTGAVARALGAVFLEETRPDSAPLPQPIDLNVELCAVQLGYGLLLLESSHLYTKACSGPRITQLTLLSPSELALLVALFAAEHRVKLKAALKASSLTQRTLLNDANDLVRANPRLLEWIIEANTSDQTPAFALNEGRAPLFAGLIEKLTNGRAQSKEPHDLEAWLDATPMNAIRQLPAQRRAETDARKPHDDLKALVAEVLDNNATGR